MSKDPSGTQGESQSRKGWRLRSLILAAVISGIACFGLAWVVVTMYPRKDGGGNPYVRLVPVDEVTTDPAQWGKNWARQYDAYQRTVDQTHTRYGGSEGAVPESRLEKDPWLKRMFAGYAFALDFRERRGHADMPSDQEQTK